MKNVYKNYRYGHASREYTCYMTQHRMATIIESIANSYESVLCDTLSMKEVL